MRRATAAITALAAMSSSGCTSIQWLDGEGTPRSLGLAYVVQSDTGPVTRIVAPGACLRLVPGLVGYSLGWRELVVYQSPGETRPRIVVAFGDRVYGAAIDSTQLVVGSAHRFGVFQPSPETDVIQVIRYSEGDPSSNWIQRLEVK